MTEVSNICLPRLVSFGQLGFISGPQIIFTTHGIVLLSDLYHYWVMFPKLLDE